MGHLWGRGWGLGNKCRVYQSGHVLYQHNEVLTSGKVGSGLRGRGGGCGMERIVGAGVGELFICGWWDFFARAFILHIKRANTKSCVTGGY